MRLRSATAVPASIFRSSRWVGYPGVGRLCATTASEASPGTLPLTVPVRNLISALLPVGSPFQPSGRFVVSGVDGAPAAATCGSFGARSARRWPGLRQAFFSSGRDTTPQAREWRRYVSVQSLRKEPPNPVAVDRQTEALTGPNQHQHVKGNGTQLVLSFEAPFREQLLQGGHPSRIFRSPDCDEYHPVLNSILPTESPRAIRIVRDLI